MRTALFVIAAAALAACAAGGSEPDVASGPSPFPVERGTAPPPPMSSASQTPPPEGRLQAGVDFGQWRSADPAAYAPAFQAQMRERFSAGQDAAQIRADLEANGFACHDAQRLDCRIEIMERDCAYDWYVVLDRGREALVAGFDKMCLGARG
ncbi:MAG TPA: hypothetical protein VEA80_05895 [Vitreimonas sp.]|uniref:hypothetical protein n=1 Tax=Vitreimonas sp. TaxID=3069702 RepID=UPI002D230290|nr:hypothetical protein [Vitreimonas sp.]HYD86984.1 hypothetical protein [Vitreimonas sp.]